MKRLSLVRHAKSSWSNPQLRDFDRPLNDRGFRDAPNVASHLKQLGLEPDAIISSAALRAETTARYMADVLLGDENQYVSEKNLYGAVAEELLYQVRMSDDHINHLMLVAHNPSISDLLDLLVDGAGYDMPTCAVAVIDLNIADWNHALPGTGILNLFISPKQLI